MEDKKTQPKVRRPAPKKKVDRFKIEETVGKRGSTFLVTGYKLDGARVRKTLKSKLKADAYVQSLSLDVIDSGWRLITTKLTDKQLEEAQAMFTLLGDSSLTKAVEYYQKNYNPVSGLPIKDAIFKLQEEKEREAKSPRTLSTLKYTWNAFAEAVGWKAVDEVTKKDVMAFLKPYSAQSKNNKRTELFTLFQWCLTEELVIKNPVLSVKRTKVMRERKFFSPKEAEALLLSAKDADDGALLAYTSLALFAGLRPNSEMCNITWQDINFEDEEINVPAGKKDENRMVKMRPSLVEMLTACDQAKPIYPANFRRKFSNVRRGAGFKGGITNSVAEAKLEADPTLKPWIQDGTRKSFITYLARDLDDVFKTASTAGTSPKMVKKHYQGAATSSQASAFFGITLDGLRKADLVKFG